MSSLRQKNQLVLQRNLCSAIKSYNVPLIDKIISDGADINGITLYERRLTYPLIVAINNIDILTHLISKGAKVNCRNYSGLSALGVAMYEELMDVMYLLIQVGADVNDRSVFQIIVSDWTVRSLYDIEFCEKALALLLDNGMNYHHIWQGKPIHEWILSGHSRLQRVIQKKMEEESCERVQERCSQFRLELINRTWNPQVPRNMWKIIDNMNSILNDNYL